MTIETKQGTTRTFGAEVLRRLEPIRALSSMRLLELSTLCTIETVSRGLDPFRLQGVTGQSVYLMTGELKVSFDDGSSCVLVGGSEASNWPLAKRSPFVSDAKAITDIELIRVDDEMLDIMMTWDQLSAGVDTSASNPEATDWRLMSGAFRLQSLTNGALSRLPAASIDELFRRFERIRIKAGEVILREGEEGDFYYIIENGRCSVSRKVGGVVMSLAELKAGDAFGEEALVAESTRNATVCMKTAGVLLRLKKNDFIELLREPLLKRVSWIEARQHVAAGAIWLDVRYPSEYQNDRLPGAVNVPLSEIRNAIDVLDRQPEYIVYCQSGRRSSAAAFLLSQRGYRAYWLKDGLKAGALPLRN
ncbi:MAG: cyclic nucleotide-binding domain-containing protein [Propionivibrio sp.]|mgnify:CR=1 FL=1|uniref:cyclic nucleotide-binding domain-containing protein n=1 Tax=Propionivibrio sp. TaxID=2212460 RepID=UPI001A58DC50|nr:cyclic nucleotide-binding domain-containing protein [Propionivibrio sp.]MBL8414759.1 cyclic nucleotide-binding domain-containing protein [Propionivibrio sp.]